MNFFKNLTQMLDFTDGERL